MADHRDASDRHPDASDRHPRPGERSYEERSGHGQQRHDRERNQPAFGGFGRGSARDRMGSEQFGSPSDFGGAGEHEYRDYGREQPGGVYEHAGQRDYRHGAGYGGYGESPGESGGGFGSGRTYAAEPGWGPGYGGQEAWLSRRPQGPGRGSEAPRSGGGDRDANPGYEGRGGHPGAYGAQQGDYGSHYGARRDFEPGRPGPRGYGQDQYGQGQREGYSGLGYSGQGYAPSGEGFGPSSMGGPQYGQGTQGHGRLRPPHGRGPKGYQRSDERVKEDICERLMAEPYLDASEVSVEVKDGKVMLEGTVPERPMKHRIEDVADACIGVKDIDNRIRVAQSGSGASGPASENGA